MRAEIARRYLRCLQATHGRSQLHERKFQVPEISIPPEIVLIRPWGPERRHGARSPFVGSGPERGKMRARAVAPFGPPRADEDDSRRYGYLRDLDCTLM